MTPIGPYLWMIGGLVLAIFEMFVPGVYLLWFGLAGVATGLLVWFWPLEFNGELISFAIFAVISVAIGRVVTRRANDAAGEQPFLNRRADGLVGRIVILTGAIENGAGRLSVDDTIWRVEGPDMPAGSRAVITGVSGTTLKVTAA
jgi:membrane protein implicated in regulation of membrane protease activity